jgi:hypothetical protein
MTQSVIPATREVDIGKVAVPRAAWAKVSKIPS